MSESKVKTAVNEIKNGIVWREIPPCQFNVLRANFIGKKNQVFIIVRCKDKKTSYDEISKSIKKTLARVEVNCQIVFKST